jgi:hypothetical protein
MFFPQCDRPSMKPIKSHKIMILCILKFWLHSRILF